MSKESKTIRPDDEAENTDSTEVGALPDDAGSLPANGFPDEPKDNPPQYEGNGAG